MYLVCKHCESYDIEITSPYDNYPFYCNSCSQYLGFDEVKNYVTLATHYSNPDYKSILVVKKSS